MAKEKFNEKFADKLSHEEAAEAIDSLETKDGKTKDALLSMLHDQLIEVYRNFNNPKEIRIGLTRKGIELFANYSSKSELQS